MWKTQMTQTRQRSEERGFTFIEVLIVIAIFSIGILAVAGMQVTSINANAAARMSGEATALATNQLETLMAADYDDAVLDPDPSVNPHQIVNGAYTISWWVTESDLINESKTVRVTVRCANPKAKDVNIQYIKHEL